MNRVPLSFEGSHMPPASARKHLSHGLDQWLGDSRRSVDDAANDPVGADGGRYVDNNMQPGLEDDLVVHSETPRKAGYHYIIVGNKRLRRKLTARELDTPWIKWSTKKVKRLRRTPRYRKGVFETSVRIDTVYERCMYARSKGVIPYFEAKGLLYATDKRYTDRAVNACRRANMPPFFMALNSMRGISGKAQNFHKSGGQFAVLAHSKHMPADFAKWKDSVTYVYGADWLGK